MNWIFQYGREWTSTSKIKAKRMSLTSSLLPADGYWLIGVCENGMFYVSGSDHETAKHCEIFPTLADAKNFCESIEKEQS